MNDLNYMDIWRAKNEEIFQFTWKRSALTLAFARLDVFLITRRTAGWVEDVAIKPSYRSDHSPVVLDIRMDPFKRGMGYWKMKTSMLEKKRIFCRYIKHNY